jgi:hypothetical protein
MVKGFITLADGGKLRYSSNLLQNFNPRKWRYCDKLPCHFYNFGPRAAVVSNIDISVSRIHYRVCNIKLFQFSIEISYGVFFTFSHLHLNLILKVRQEPTRVEHLTRIKKKESLLELPTNIRRGCMLLIVTDGLAYYDTETITSVNFLWYRS